MKILIDNGHGKNTPGKCSPDGRLREWKYNREIAVAVYERLKALGYDTELIVREDTDISLTERCRRVNQWCSKVGTSNCIFVSVHVNAAGHGTWLNATGWSGWVGPNASNKSKQMARIFYEEAEKRGLKGNRSVPSGKYWVGNFTVLTKTKCPAVLTENLFQDNREDVNYLLSDEGRKTIVDLHVEAIKRIIAE